MSSPFWLQQLKFHYVESHKTQMTLAQRELSANDERMEKPEQMICHFLKKICLFIADLRHHFPHFPQAKSSSLCNLTVQSVTN